MLCEMVAGLSFLLLFPRSVQLGKTAQSIGHNHQRLSAPRVTISPNSNTWGKAAAV